MLVDWKTSTMTSAQRASGYPAAFDELLFSLPDVIDYQVTLNTEGNKDIILFKIEVVRKEDNIQKIINDMLLSHPLIRKNLAANLLGLSPIELVSPGNLTRLNRAKKLIADKRRMKA